MIDDDKVLFEYNGIQKKIKEIKEINFHTNPVHDEKNIKAEVK